MATQITTGQASIGKKSRRVRAHLASPHIDMTPMVDLGFLLLTFFVLTTTLHTHNSMQVVMPIPEPDVEQPVPLSRVLQLVIGKQNRIYYYRATDADIQVHAAGIPLQMTNFSKDGIRQVLAQQRRMVANHSGHAGDMIVLIKLMDEANYKNFVDILDEMAIMGVTRFATVDIHPVEVAMVQAYDSRLGLY